MNETKKYRVDFRLYADRLEVRHNGIPFDENDVRGVCGILEEKLDKSIPQIGKFGIGFKSVYAYTVSPEIHSGNRSFFIRNYVLPFPVGKEGDDGSYQKIREENTGYYGTRINVIARRLLANLYSDKTHFVYELLQNAEDACERARNQIFEETLLIMRFDCEGIVKDEAHIEIKNRLRNLGLRTLLFLNKIEEISYKVDSTEGRFVRSSRIENGVKQLSLFYIENGNQKLSEKWLILDKPFTLNETRKLEIAYLLVYDPHLKKERIRPARDLRLFTYFPTEKETHLRFLMQGPYNVNPNRENIYANDKWNEKLIEETAELVSDSMPKIRSLGLLDVGFLSTLPLNTEYFTQEDALFRPIYERVKERLGSDEPLLPADDGGFVACEQAFLGGGKDLRQLLRSEQLDCLFERRGCKWLDENITEDKEPDLWKYLTKELIIGTIDPDRFAREFNDGFISKQTDQWVSLFYSFLADHDGLWKKGYSWERPGPLRSKHIIRLSDDSHIAPFCEDEKIQVYLPHRNPEINRLFLCTVKATVSSDKKARDFLRALGINEPDEVAIVLRVILPIYRQMATVSEKDNAIHVRSILRILENCENSRKEEFLEELKNTPFLFASNASLDQQTYKKPADIHLGGEYTGSRVLEIYFEGNEEAWFLDRRYMDLADDKRMVEMLEQMGCASRIRVNYTEPDFLNYVWIRDSRARHKRGVNGFDPYCEIEGLGFALRNINLERSKLIWNLALEHRQRVYGLVQSSNKKNFADCCDMYSLSKIGELLAESQWLPSPNGSSFLKPSDLFLSELPDGFDKESAQARDLAKKLDFKQEIDEELQEVIAQTPDELKEIAEELMSLPPEIRKEATERALEAIKSSAAMLEEPFDSDTATEISVSPTPAELMAEFLEESHVQEQPPSTSVENKTWKGPTPEEIERMLKYEEEVMSQLGKSTQVIQKKPMQISDIVTRGIENPILKAFLLEQYDGHCQICNTRLGLGAGKHPHVDIFRFIEKRRLVGAWSDLEFSVLGICPNCHALMKHAEGNNVRRPVLDKARQVLNNEAGPEEVSERGGDFYIVSITLAEKEKQLYFAPRHMAKISAFIKMLESFQSK